MRLDAAISKKCRALSFVGACVVVAAHFSSTMPSNNVWNVIWREVFAYGIFDYAVSFFFVLSGFFAMKRFDGHNKFRWYSELILKRTRTLLVPYLIINTIGVVFLGGGVGEGYGILSTLPVITPLWYVRNLFIFCALIPVFAWGAEMMEKLRGLRIVAVVIFLLLCVIEYPLKKNIVMAAIFFELGIVLWRVPDDSLAKIGKWRSLFIWLLAICLCAKLIGIHFEYRVSYLRYFIIPLTIVILWYYFDSFVKRFPVIAEWLSRLSAFAFPIYAFHYFILSPFMKSGIGTRFWINMASACATIVIIIFLSIIVKRMSPRLYSVLCGGRG